MKNIIFGSVGSMILISLTGCSVSSFNPFDDSKSSGIADLDKIYNEYKTFSPNKAMAVIISADKRFASGYSFEFASQDKANTEALKRCNTSNTKSKNKISGECKLYAIGDKIVY